MKRLFMIFALSILTLGVIVLLGPGKCKPEKCDEPETGEEITVVFMADFNDGLKDDNCDPINKTKWLDGVDAGENLFIVGAVHHYFKDTEDPNGDLSAKLGNWTPNKIAMYDDGTHGDKKAGDNIWSIELKFPVGTHLAYKYTWGKTGAGWTGTEEFPGNSRLLEVKNVSGDCAMVIRYDNFADETTNKDVMNLNKNGNGCICWEGYDCDGTGDLCSTQKGIPDNNGDGNADYYERQVDTNGDCKVDTWPEALKW